MSEREHKSHVDAADELQRLVEQARQLQVELDRFAGRVERRLDEKLAQLQKLTHAVDARIARLEKLLGAAGPATAAIKINQAAATEAVRLNRMGLENVEIARRLNMDVGEVELILGLHVAAIDESQPRARRGNTG